MFLYNKILYCIKYNLNLNMQDDITKKLENTISKSNSNKSHFWVRRIKGLNKTNPNPIDTYDIFQSSEYGPYLKKKFLSSILHYLGQLKLYGPTIFKSGTYKKYKKVLDGNGRQIDFQVLKHILWIEKIKNHIKNKKKICVIGDSKLNFLLGAYLTNQDAQLFSINLPEVLITDYLVMKKINFLKGSKIEVVENFKDFNYSEKVKLYMIPASEAEFCKNKNIDFFFNSHSLQEMTKEEVEKYFEIMKSNKALFYCNNRKFKRGFGGDKDFHFENLPWDNSEFLIKETCTVCEKYYNFRPPFIRKFDEHIHCLVKFN